MHPTTSIKQTPTVIYGFVEEFFQTERDREKGGLYNNCASMHLVFFLPFFFLT